MRATRDQVLEISRGKRKARFAPERADRRNCVFQAPREKARRDGDDLFGERKRDHLLLVAAIGVERAIFAAMESGGMRLAQRESLANDMQLCEPVAETREELRRLRCALLQLGEKI